MDAGRRRAVVASPEREEQEGFKEQAATALRLARALDESNPLVEEHFAVADASWKAVQALWASEAEEKERAEAADAWAEASGLTDCEWHSLVSEPQSVLTAHAWCWQMGSLASRARSSSSSGSGGRKARRKPSRRRRDRQRTRSQSQARGKGATRRAATPCPYKLSPN
eukprot:COSAG04_NODE_779_length_10341_cov_3.429799_3_plen_168_part_00